MKIIWKLASRFYRNNKIIRDSLSHIRRCHRVKYCNVNMNIEKCHHCDCHREDFWHQRCITTNSPGDRHKLIRYSQNVHRKIKPCVNPCQFSNMKHTPQPLRLISAFRYLNTTQKYQSTYYLTQKKKMEQMKFEKRYFYYIHQIYCYCRDCEPYYANVNNNPIRSMNIWSVICILYLGVQFLDIYFTLWFLISMWKWIIFLISYPRHIPNPFFKEIMNKYMLISS